MRMTDATTQAARKPHRCDWCYERINADRIGRSGRMDRATPDGLGNRSVLRRLPALPHAGTIGGPRRPIRSASMPHEIAPSLGGSRVSIGQRSA